MKGRFGNFLLYAPASIFSFQHQSLPNTRLQSDLDWTKHRIFAAVPRHEGTEFNSDRWLGIEAGHDEPDIEPMMPLESGRSQLTVRITACPVVPYA
jgi:hypothetical protein